MTQYIPTINEWLLKGTGDSVNFPEASEVENYGDFARLSRQQILNYYLNDTTIPSIIEAKTSGVIGKGINLQARFDTIGLDELNEEFEKLFRLHARPENFDVRQRWGFNEFLRQVIAAEVLWGGCLLRHHYSSKAGWKVPYKLEMISIDRIATAFGENGYETDRYGAVTHIWIYTDAKRQTAKRFRARNFTIYAPTWIGPEQVSAVSPLVRILPLLAQIRDLRQAELDAAKNRAKSGIFWKTELYSAVMAKLEDLKNSLGTEQAAELSRQIMDMLADKAKVPRGVTPVPMNDDFFESKKSPESTFDAYLSEAHRSAAAALGSSYVSTTGDVSVGNYSSLKLDASRTDNAYQVVFDRLVTNVIHPYISRLFTVGIQAGFIKTVTRTNFFKDPDYYLDTANVSIMRTVRVTSDEYKDAMAAKVALEAGITTYPQVYARNGSDWETEIAKQERQRQRIMEQLGIDPLGMVSEGGGNLTPEEMDQESGDNQDNETEDDNVTE